ncbi:beta-lactamase family protein [Actinoplanes sp. NBC_00393]|uniref:serine hydrolase domain-containing protein n=1 Tax=Actinoplanes sp. NBC_00393 TaxID=2975953 RepID=UPI002E1F180E
MRERIVTFCTDNQIPGFLAGVSRGGEQTVIAHGVASLATGEPMREDTGFLFGSVTKIMTTTLVMQQVERGNLDLDAPVSDYLPEFRPAGVRVRHLIDHTSGIDADLFFPDEDGPDALEIYVDRLGRECGSLFAPGEFVSYSNGGMIVAGRLLEVVTGLAYPELLRREVLAETPSSLAVGHFPDPVTGEVRPTSMFRLPATWGPAGGTAVGTIEDLLAFGRGEGLLSEESLRQMQTIQHRLGTPDSSPVGLGWLIRELGGQTVLTMTGASPAGVAVLAVIPSQDLVFAAYGNDARALALHEELLFELAGGSDYPALAPVAADLDAYAGTYRSHQLRIDVRVVDGELEEQVTYEPADADQERIFTGFVGGPFTAPPMRYVPVGKDLFAPAGMPLDDMPPYYLVSYHGGGAYRCSGGRLTRRVPV